MRSTSDQRIKAQQKLLDKAYQMVMRGWSVIPLRGIDDPVNPKAPAIASWKEYQTRRPRFTELEHWFFEEQYGAIGLVLGRISGIVVIDIDKPEIEEAFREALPHLTDTYTVRSGNRKLPHYYYALPPTLEASGRTACGIEFRSDGQYVVAPTVVIGEAEWRVEKAQVPYPLNTHDLSDIFAFMGLYTRNSKKPEKTALKCEIEPSPITFKPPPDERLTPEDLREWYVENARIHGRNNALFAGGCYARDLGWSQSQVSAVLTPLHVTQPPNWDHPPETTGQRMEEARRTLNSVFKRPPSIRKRRDKPTAGLPNAVREWLMQHKLDNTARVLDGLILAGARPNDTFTAYQACEWLKPMGIGRNAVYSALASQLENGQTVFPVSLAADGSAPLPPHPLHPGANADTDKNTLSTQCLSGRGTKAGKNRGRPIRVFVMPSNASLCQRLAVRDRGSDPITPEDLQTPATYRRALHKALINRAPQPYGRTWQAKRLGVHIKTIRRYDKKADISSIPQFHSQPLGWTNYEKLCPDELKYGLFVTDETGERHPAHKGKVRALLAKKHRLVLHRQLPNYYHVSQTSSTDVMPEASKSKPTKSKRVSDKKSCAQSNTADTKSNTTLADKLDYRQRWIQAIERAISRLSIEPATSSANDKKSHQFNKKEQANKSKQQDISQIYRRPEKVVVGEGVAQYVLPLDNQKKRDNKAAYEWQVTSDKGTFGPEEKACVDRLYWTLRRMNAQKSITKELAKTWVKTYGIEAIDRHLDILKRKTDVRNPAGYLRTLLRIDAKVRAKK